jgi:hypothetical protein
MEIGASRALRPARQRINNVTVMQHCANGSAFAAGSNVSGSTFFAPPPG